jgi:hypothetical protein
LGGDVDPVVLRFSPSFSQDVLKFYWSFIVRLENQSDTDPIQFVVGAYWMAICTAPQLPKSTRLSFLLYFLLTDSCVQ